MMLPEINAIFRNNSPTPYPDQQTVVDLFEQQAAKTPQQIAFILGQLAASPTQQLTYEELNQRANQLAHYLTQRGIGPDKIVGVYLERSLDMVVALLAILKTGAAYLPLDPTYPLERLAFMIADSQAPFIITQPELPPPPHQAEVIFINTPLPPAPLTNPPSKITPDPPMYIMYTSGSTGQPKGVVGLHRGAVNRFQWMWTTYPFTPHEVCCQKTALSFVDSVWEIFGPLLQGIPIVIIPAALAQAPFQLIQILAQYQVTRLVLVPSLLRAMLYNQPQLPHLKYCISSGETLPIDLYHQFTTLLPHAILLNLYGSSEVAADATWYDTSLNTVTDFVPIGRPIANMEVHILDEALQPVDVGTLGELYIGGVGLAQGYLHRPDLTSERFISLPGRAGRFYKSGDLGQYLPDGNIQYLGRRDHQVKIRGYRVELDEIEIILRQHPSVSNTVVVAHNEASPRLVAYLVLLPESLITLRELRHYLSQKLPDYMIPSAFVLLEAMPLTPSGKINRLALPAPTFAQWQPYLAPRNPVEELMVQLWAETLGIEQLGINDNFLELGGHSLLAMQLITQIRATFKVELTLKDIIESATIAALVERLIQQEAKPGQVATIARLRQQISHMSDSEIKQLLQAKQS